MHWADPDECIVQAVRLGVPRDDGPHQGLGRAAGGTRQHHSSGCCGYDGRRFGLLALTTSGCTLDDGLRAEGAVDGRHLPRAHGSDELDLCIGAEHIDGLCAQTNARAVEGPLVYLYLWLDGLRLLRRARD